MRAASRLGSARASRTRASIGRRSTWAPALEGVRAVYLTYYPDLALPGALGATRDFAELALKRGASGLALLSGRGEREAERAEEAVRDTGAELTIPLDLVHAELQRGLLARARRERRARLPAAKCPRRSWMWTTSRTSRSRP